MQNIANFEKWAHGKHPFLAITAHGLVLQSKMAYGFIKAIHDNDLFLDEIPAPDLDTWLKLFRTHPSLMNYIAQSMGDPTGYFHSVDTFIDSLTDDQINSSDLSSSESQELFEQYLNSARDIEAELDNHQPPENLEKFFSSPDFYFLFRVCLPCWVIHFTTPAQLLRKARVRDFDSLKKLIKLDPSTIFDKKISRHIHDLRSKNRSRYEQILNLLQNKSKSQISKQKFKVLYAAIITNFSIEFGERLTEPEVRGLFDAVARDEERGEIDTDLPESPHALYMGIKRHLDANR